ncbi:hypothetical protein ABEF95_015920 [Exophiala dermatitidis]
MDTNSQEDTMPSLRTYLQTVRRLVLQGTTSTKPASGSGAIRQNAAAGHGHDGNTTTTATGTRGNRIEDKLVLVMGNPSADLDSFISAVVLSYFYNSKPSDSSKSKRDTSTRYVPVLNLPTVRSRDLWRLRPEFGVALRFALGEDSSSTTSTNAFHDEQKQEQEQGQGQGQTKVGELEELITVADIKSDPRSKLYSLFANSKTSSGNSSSHDDNRDYDHEQQHQQPLFLLDHNAPSIPGLSDQDIQARFTVTGCIDHHVDEGYVSQQASPRIITTGIGSCTSLVVKYLRDQGMWPETSTRRSGMADSKSDSIRHIQQISKLALAPILIDTSNLRATGDKCSDLDREVVAFLEDIIDNNDTPTRSLESANVAQQQQQPQARKNWDHDAFYHAVATAKANSLNLLTMQETFDRDYKAWCEPIGAAGGCTSSTSTSGGGVDVNIGISSLVKPLSWLVKHAGGAEAFLNEIETFATAEERRLGVFAMLTRAGDRKEVVVLTFNDKLRGLTSGFEDKAGNELRLQTWDEDSELLKALENRFNSQGEYKIWWMGDTSKSRKQVGPLLREAVRKL